MTTPDPNGPHGNKGTRVDRIRVRLVWALLAPFCVLMATSTVEGFSAAGPGRTETAIAVLVASAVFLPVLMAWLARDPAGGDRARERTSTAR
jgi:hypothetical protein